MDGLQFVPAQACSSKRQATAWVQESSAGSRHTTPKANSRCISRRATHSSLTARVANNVLLRLLDTHCGNLQEPFPTGANKKCWMPTCEKELESPKSLLLHIVHDCSETNKGVVECRNLDCGSYNKTHDFRRWPFSGTLMSLRHLKQAFSVRRKRPQDVVLEANELAFSADKSLASPSPSASLELETKDIGHIQLPAVPMQYPFVAPQEGQQPGHSTLELLGDLSHRSELPASRAAVEMSAASVDPRLLTISPHSRHPDQRLDPLDTGAASQFGFGHATQIGVRQGSNDFSPSYPASVVSPQSLDSSVSSQMTQLTTPISTSPSSWDFPLKLQYPFEPLSEAVCCENVPSTANGQAPPLQTQYLPSQTSIISKTSEDGPVYHEGLGSTACMSHTHDIHVMLAAPSSEYTAEQQHGGFAPLHAHAQLTNGQENVLQHRDGVDAVDELGEPLDQTIYQVQDGMDIDQLVDQYSGAAEASPTSPAGRPQKRIKMAAKVPLAGIDPDECPEPDCSYRYTPGMSKRNYDSHKERHRKTHDPKFRHQLKCSYCRATFNGGRTDNLKQHMRRKHAHIIQSSTSPSEPEVASGECGPVSDQPTVNNTIPVTASTSASSFTESGFEDPENHLQGFSFPPSAEPLGSGCEGSGVASYEGLEMNEFLVAEDDNGSLYAALPFNTLPTTAQNWHFSPGGSF